MGHTSESMLRGRHLVLNTPTLRFVVLFLPVLMVPILYFFMYRPYVMRTIVSRSFSFQRISGLLLSFVAPLYCSCTLAESHFEEYFRDYFASGGKLRRMLQPVTGLLLEAVRLVGLCVMLLCVETSAFLDDLKDHSGMERNTCTYSVLLFFISFLHFLGLYIPLSYPSITACLHSLTRHDV